jgi:hypothetical protein
MAAIENVSDIRIRRAVFAGAMTIALTGWVAHAAAQGTSGARIGSAGFNAGTLVGSIGGGPGLSGGTAHDAARIRGVAEPEEAGEAPAAAPAAPTGATPTGATPPTVQPSGPPK